jgi:hypothetical protein
MASDPGPPANGRGQAHLSNASPPISATGLNPPSLGGRTARAGSPWPDFAQPGLHRAGDCLRFDWLGRLAFRPQAREQKNAVAGCGFDALPLPGLGHRAALGRGPGAVRGLVLRTRSNLPRAAELPLASARGPSARGPSARSRLAYGSRSRARDHHRLGVSTGLGSGLKSKPL